jgi:poly(3-hydroxybutyrate) depolymerase
MLHFCAQFGTGNSLNDVGYVYVPTACKNGAECALHVNFHGCQQTLADIGMQYVQHVGLNEWAESNNIIVVYPQVRQRREVGVTGVLFRLGEELVTVVVYRPV